MAQLQLPAVSPSDHYWKARDCQALINDIQMLVRQEGDHMTALKCMLLAQVHGLAEEETKMREMLAAAEQLGASSQSCEGLTEAIRARATWKADCPPDFLSSRQGSGGKGGLIYQGQRGSRGGPGSAAAVGGGRYWSGANWTPGPTPGGGGGAGLNGQQAGGGNAGQGTSQSGGTGCASRSTPPRQQRQHQQHSKPTNHNKKQQQPAFAANGSWDAAAALAGNVFGSFTPLLSSLSGMIHFTTVSTSATYDVTGADNGSNLASGAGAQGAGAGSGAATGLGKPSNLSPDEAAVLRVASSTNHFEVLGLPGPLSPDWRGMGVAGGPTEPEIKRAFKLASLKLHPDKNSSLGAAEAFQCLTDCRDCLVDYELRVEHIQQVLQQRGCKGHFRYCAAPPEAEPLFSAFALQRWTVLFREDPAGHCAVVLGLWCFWVVYYGSRDFNQIAETDIGREVGSVAGFLSRLISLFGCIFFVLTTLLAKAFILIPIFGLHDSPDPAKRRKVTGLDVDSVR